MCLLIGKYSTTVWGYIEEEIDKTMISQVFTGGMLQQSKCIIMYQKYSIVILRILSEFIL